MDLPAGISRDVEAAHGSRSHITSVNAVHGGCITPVARIDFDDGTTAFLKWSEAAAVPTDFFREEAHSLRVLAATETIRTPAVLGEGNTWLLLEWLEAGRPDASTWRDLGCNLARMHKEQNESFGWKRNNWIGSLPQSNSSHDRWADFWRQERISPQWSRARASGFFQEEDERLLDRVMRSLDDLLAPGDADGPSLLHGDLWNGNVHVLSSGVAALIDPSCYCGHREVDLAMAALFGGFTADFFREYERTWPLASGWQRRRHAYQLYYLLVHVNLFGASYVTGVRSALHGALRD